MWVLVGCGGGWVLVGLVVGGCWSVGWVGLIVVGYLSVGCAEVDQLFHIAIES